MIGLIWAGLWAWAFLQWAEERRRLFVLRVRLYNHPANVFFSPSLYWITASRFHEGFMKGLRRG